MRVAVIGLASSHVDQIIRLCAGGRLGSAQVNALIAPVMESVDQARIGALHRTLPTVVGETPLTGEDDPAAEPEDIARALAGRVDAAIIATRDSAGHRALAEPLLRADIPVFVDKPFVTDPADAEALVALAERRGVPITSSSALRWHPQVLEAADRWAVLPGGLTCHVAGPADPSSPHGGRMFLGVHAVEAALALLRGRPGTVRVHDHDGHRFADIEAGADRAVVDLGPHDGLRLVGPGIDTPLRLDPEFLRPGLMDFLAGVHRGDRHGPLSGIALIDAARVLADVCR